jgi:hypothetical protein
VTSELDYTNSPLILGSFAQPQQYQKLVPAKMFFEAYTGNKLSSYSECLEVLQSFQDTDILNKPKFDKSRRELEQHNPLMDDNFFVFSGMVPPGKHCIIIKDNVEKVGEEEEN